MTIYQEAIQTSFSVKFDALCIQLRSPGETGLPVLQSLWGYMTLDGNDQSIDVHNQTGGLYAIRADATNDLFYIKSTIPGDIGQVVDVTTVSITGVRTTATVAMLSDTKVECTDGLGCQVCEEIVVVSGTALTGDLHTRFANAADPNAANSSLSLLAGTSRSCRTSIKVAAAHEWVPVSLSGHSSAEAILTVQVIESDGLETYSMILAHVNGSFSIDLRGRQPIPALRTIRVSASGPANGIHFELIGYEVLV